MAKMSSKKSVNLDFMDLGATGVGAIGGGIINKVVAKVKPDAPAFIGAAVNVVGGYFLTRMANKNLQYLGLGMFSRGVSDGANVAGIGEDMISETLDLDNTMEAELAAELAEEMEAELAEMDEVSEDGSY
jgi:hypothetical protein